MDKHFNTAGPGIPELHYLVDPLSRIDLAEIESLIGQQRYFVLHAPRQTGKTTCLLALRSHFNEQGPPCTSTSRRRRRPGVTCEQRWRRCSAH